jgi:hypothetical protein
MKNSTLIFVIFGMFSCTDDFTKEEYDVSLNFENKTTENIKISVFETNNQIKWENNKVDPNENLNIYFNIKKDIGTSEGGFVFKAFFQNGDSIISNTGYFTNFQFQGKNPIYYKVSKNGFQPL